jgi:hypothetical protein
MAMEQRWVVDPQLATSLTCFVREALQCRLSLGFSLQLTWPLVRAGKMTGNVVLVQQHLLLYTSCKKMFKENSCAVS